MKRFLITTADERTWKFDSPVLFLNEWCRLYDRKSVWESMDGVVADPFEMQPEQQKKNIAYIQELTGQLLIELSAALNSNHNTNHTLRYWNILLGHWLERYVFLIFDRYYTLDQAIRNNDLAATIISETSEYSLATSDSLNAIWACSDDTWNHVLYSNILRFIGGVEIEYKSIELEEGQSFDQNDHATSGRSLSIKKTIFEIAKKILPVLSSQKDALIIGSYLPRGQEVLLQLALRQCPQVWNSPRLQTETINRVMRQNLTVGDDSHVGFEHFLRIQLPEIIPICYLEGYDQLCHQVAKLAWPKFPKFIFTSNNFDTDEIFKAWTGEKVEQGVPYFVGQHGANYGTFYGSEQFTIALTCDRFFTWGWSNNNDKNIPAFIFKNANKNKTKTLKNGGLLLIQLPVLHRFGLADINAAYSDFTRYQEDQFRFVTALPGNIKNRLTVRLHREWRKHRWSDKRRWSDRHPFIRLELGSAPLKSLISKSRLVVHSYDSTGILETLSSNIPTVCFWYGGLFHLLSNAKPYYELLRGAGILADTPEQAAQLVEQYWDDIDGWWESEQVQSARRIFCEKYARIEKHPVQTMKLLLTTEALIHSNQTKNT